jgi:hypothetical protein
MNIVVFEIQKGCEVLNERWFTHVDETSDELSSIIVIAWDDSSQPHDAVDLKIGIVATVSDNTKNTIWRALHVSFAIAIGNTDGVIDRVSIGH